MYKAAIRPRGHVSSQAPCVLQILLPPSASPELMAQDAPKNGAMFFELRAGSGATTHAGLLDFTAGEGTVGVPPQVAASLWPSGSVPVGEQVTITYRRLEKGAAFSTALPCGYSGILSRMPASSL